MPFRNNVAPRLGTVSEAAVRRGIVRLWIRFTLLPPPHPPPAPHTRIIFSTAGAFFICF
jgi:hypothetical protein